MEQNDSDQKFDLSMIQTEGPYKDLHKNVVVKEHPIFGGKGIFAVKTIRQGEIIWHDSTPTKEIKEYDMEEVETWDDQKKEWFLSFAYQVGEKSFRGPIDQIETMDLYTNHSCDPTVWWEDESTMSARRDIEEGEELTFDYATSETIETAIRTCGCGSKDCRKLITPEDWRKKDLQEKYKGHFMPYLQRKINQFQEKK